MSSLKNELSKVSRNLDRAKDSYRLEYVKSKMGASAFHLQLKKSNLISIMGKYHQILHEKLPLKKNKWTQDVQKISRIATLDMSKLKETGGIGEVSEIKNQIDSYKDNIIKVIQLKEEFKISFEDIMGLDAEVDEEIHKMYLIVDQHIQFGRSKISNIDKIIQLVDISLKD